MPAPLRLPARSRPIRSTRSTAERGWGAWELAARYSVTDLDSDDVNGGNQKVYGLALSWYPNSLLRFILQGNYVNVDREECRRHGDRPGFLGCRVAQPDRLLKPEDSRRIRTLRPKERPEAGPFGSDKTRRYAIVRRRIRGASSGVGHGKNVWFPVAGGSGARISHIRYSVGTAEDDGTARNVMLIVDASGSMKKAVDGRIPHGGGEARPGRDPGHHSAGGPPRPARLRASQGQGLQGYGAGLPDRRRRCGDDRPDGSRSSRPRARRRSRLRWRWRAKSFLAFKGQANSIVLVTDGIEECKGDPCAAAAAIKASGLDVKVDVVGFTLKPEQRKLIEWRRDRDRRHLLRRQERRGLSTALATVAKAATKPQSRRDDDLIAQKNGGVLLAAANDDWQKLNDGKEDDRAVTYNTTGIYGFKDGKPATLTGGRSADPGAERIQCEGFRGLRRRRKSDRAASNPSAPSPRRTSS